MIKAICPKCNSLILVNEKDNQIKCPNCQEEIFVSSAAKLFEKAVLTSKRKAEMCLVNKSDYEAAFTHYSMFLKLCENSLVALSGATIAKLFCSNLHRVTIKDATDILLKGSDKITISEDNAHELSEFLQKMRIDAYSIVDAFKQYKEESNYAYNLYLQALNEYKYFLKAYIDIYKALDKYNKFFADKLEDLNDDVKKVDTLLKEKVNVKNPSKEKHDFIKDNKVINDIFPSNYRMFKISIALYTAMFIGIVLAIVGIVLLSKDVNVAVKVILVVGGMALLIGGYFINHYLREKNKKKNN